MKTLLHKSADRGTSDLGWLKSRFSFSFADWHDPERMGFGALRVLNDDFIAPRSGFGLHAHRDMEIVTVVTAGTVTHEDSMGNGEKIGTGEVQVMTAGSGVTHSEYNHRDEPLTLFQLWILPRARGLKPRYMQWKFGPVAPGEQQMLVSPDGAGESLMIHQDAYIHRLALTKGASAAYDIKVPGNGAYAFVISGEATVADVEVGLRDAVGVWDTASLPIEAGTDLDLLIIEVPMS